MTFGAHEGAVHGVGRRGRAALDAGQGQGLGHRRVLDAAGLVARADPPRGRRTASRRAAPRRSSGSSAGRCAPCATWGRSASAQIIVDCDVLQADGGTRTASICGGYVALHDALTRLWRRGTITDAPARARRAPPSRSASSTACPMLDLPYVEDVRAEVDMNVVMTGAGRFIEVQGTAEGLAVQPPRARRPAGAGRGGASPRSSRCRRECSPTPPAARPA